MVTCWSYWCGLVSFILGDFLSEVIEGKTAWALTVYDSDVDYAEYDNKSFFNDAATAQKNKETLHNKSKIKHMIKLGHILTILFYKKNTML